jgi:DNA-binding SARP family transcriptional activator
MPFSAKSAMPYGRDPVAGHWAFDEAADGGSTMFAAAPGYLLTEGLAEAVQRRGRRILWVRVGREDGDPGVLLGTLIAAMRHLDPEAGAATLELMRRQPGPLSGWPYLFRHLGQELGRVLAGNGTLVLEDVHHLNQERPTLALVGQHLLPSVAGAAATCILTSSDELPAGTMAQPATRRSSDHLRLGPAAVREALERVAPGIGSESVRRAGRLCLGQAALVAALCATAAALGPGTAEQAIGQAGSPDRLLELLASAWLMTMDASGWRALGLAVRVEYCNAALSAAALAGAEPPSGPWLQPLAGGWSRVRPAWKASLAAALTSRAPADGGAVRRVADFLLAHGVPERAVPLYLDLGDTDGGARAIAERADELLDLGQWETLGAWLDRLPDEVTDADPRLLYGRGEIAAARGQADLAERQFALAAARFTARNDPEGACRSMLAESNVCVSRGDPAQARARALAASALADAATITRYQVRACWQLGVLAAADGQPDDAIVYFDRAAGLVQRHGDPRVAAFMTETGRLARNLQELRRQREALHQTYSSLRATEQAARKQLLAHAALPRGELQAFVGVHGWSATPPVLKLATPEPDPAAPALPAEPGWRHRIRHVLRPQRSTALPQRPAEPGESPPPAPPEVPVPPAAPAASLDDPGTTGADALTVHMLGNLRVTVGEVPVAAWPSRRGRALLLYLLVHRHPWPSREALMEEFWPGAAPDAARNSLNVAVHGLRRALRTATDANLVRFEEGHYRLDPDVRLWLDVEEFERHVDCGREHEKTGEMTAATAEYELAASLYQGDFLAEDPYEEWPVLTRERLRLAYLDTMDRLSHLYFTRAQYAACATLCQRILERDPCREDAHRRLMRCYSRQGQTHLALRQFRACTDSLRDELGVEPAPTTALLHERIRRREQV